MFEYSNTNKRYHTVDYFFKQKFSKKVAKIPIDCGFSCPNLDGSKSNLGCSFCFSGSGKGSCSPVLEQFEQNKLLYSKWKDKLYLPYLQSNSNTYTSVQKLNDIVSPLLLCDDVVGLSIATRCDCITEEMLDYLQSINEKTFLIVEMGLQTIHDQTEPFLNRCYNFEQFAHTTKLLAQRGIHVCAHLINGLPNETAEMMLQSAITTAMLPIGSIKLQLLHFMRGTKMATYLKNNDVTPLTQQQYINLVVEQLRHIPSNIVIQRVTGDGLQEHLIEPLWSVDKRGTINGIDKLMREQNIYQGDKL